MIGIARFTLTALLGAALAASPSPAARAADPISEQDAHAIGVAAYLYFYSLITMDVTRRQLTNVAKPEGMHTADEFVRQPSRIPSGGHEGRGPAKL